MCKETDMNWPDHRGAQIVCQDCRNEGDPILWKVLLFIARGNGRRFKKEQEEQLSRAAEEHEKNHPDHRVVRWNFKKLI